MTLGRGPWLDFGMRRRPPAPEAVFAAQDGVKLPPQPRQALGSARKGCNGGQPAGEAMALQQRPGRGPFVELVECQRMQEMFGGRRRALGKSFQEDQRPLRPLLEQRRRGGHDKNERIAGARRDRLLRERQETRMGVWFSEGREQPLRPDVGLIRRLREQVGLAQC